MGKTVGRWRGLTPRRGREGELRWISGVKGTAKRRREGGTERMKENLLARAWQDRSNIYTYVAREINITLWILRSLWKPCQVNKSIKFSHFIGRSCIRLIPEERVEEKERYIDGEGTERERERWKLRAEEEARGERGRYKIKRSLRIRGRLTLSPPLLHRPRCPILPEASHLWMLGNWFLPSDRWKSGDLPYPISR